MKKKANSTKENQPRTPRKPLVNIRSESTDASDVIQLILRDHVPLKELIETLKDEDLDRIMKEQTFEEFVPLLMSHAKAEEQSLYVQMKENKGLRMEGFEGETEHALADQLIHEINATPDDDEWNAKVKVIAELVEHHIEEEEETILKDVEAQMELATRVAVGDVYTKIKADFDLLMQPRSNFEDAQIERQLN